MIVTEFRERVVGSPQRRVIGTVVVDEATGGYSITGRLEIERISILDRKVPGGRLWLRWYHGKAGGGAACLHLG